MSHAIDLRDKHDVFQPVMFGEYLLFVLLWDQYSLLVRLALNYKSLYLMLCLYDELLSLCAVASRAGGGDNSLQSHFSSEPPAVLHPVTRCSSACSACTLLINGPLSFT